MIKIVLFALLAFGSGFATKVCALDDQNFKLIQKVKKAVASTTFEAKPKGAWVYFGLMGTTRINTEESDDDFIAIAIQLCIWGEIDLVKLLWWESPRSERRIFIAALLIGDARSDLEDEYSLYFRGALSQFDQQILTLRKSELEDAKKVGHEIKDQLWIAKSKIGSK